MSCLDKRKHQNLKHVILLATSAYITVLKSRMLQILEEFPFSSFILSSDLHHTRLLQWQLMHRSWPCLGLYPCPFALSGSVPLPLALSGSVPLPLCPVWVCTLSRLSCLGLYLCSFAPSGSVPCPFAMSESVPLPLCPVWVCTLAPCPVRVCTLAPLPCLGLYPFPSALSGSVPLQLFGQALVQHVYENV